VARLAMRRVLVLVVGFIEEAPIAPASAHPVPAALPPCA
jgi:hypothetical protein